ncbi:MAG: hypothetical protein ACJAU6_000910 [Alphaproteobacteria bacterium]|jgi:hypothetical protein
MQTKQVAILKTQGSICLDQDGVVLLELWETVR